MGWHRGLADFDTIIFWGYNSSYLSLFWLMLLVFIERISELAFIFFCCVFKYFVSKHVLGVILCPWSPACRYGRHLPCIWSITSFSEVSFTRSTPKQGFQICFWSHFLIDGINGAAEWRPSFLTRSCFDATKERILIPLFFFLLISSSIGSY